MPPIRATWPLGSAMNAQTAHVYVTRAPDQQVIGNDGFPRLMSIALKTLSSRTIRMKQPPEPPPSSSSSSSSSSPPPPPRDVWKPTCTELLFTNQTPNLGPTRPLQTTRPKGKHLAWPWKCPNLLKLTPWSSCFKLGFVPIEGSLITCSSRNRPCESLKGFIHHHLPWAHCQVETVNGQCVKTHPHIIFNQGCIGCI